MADQPPREYVFIRKDVFYVIPLRDNEDARKSAEFNPGTVRVEDMDGNVVWPLH